MERVKTAGRPREKGKYSRVWCSLLAGLMALVLAIGSVTLPAQAAWPDDPIWPDQSANYYSDAPFAISHCTYLDDAIFIGNSRMKGFVLWCGIPNLQPVVAIGWKTGEFFTKKAISLNGEKLTGAEAVRQYSFNKAYINFGLNEAGNVAPEQFAANIAAIVEYLYTINPDVIVYVNSVLPVGTKASQTYPTVDQSAFEPMNAALQKMCEQEHCVYLDTASAYKDENGMMPDDYTWDGVHITDKHMDIWRDFVLSHTIPTRSEQAAAEAQAQLEAWLQAQAGIGEQTSSGE